MVARIRSVKPELFKHEALFELERASGLPLRLAYIGMWTQADREGRFLWRPRALKTDVFPYDVDMDFGAILDALERGGFLLRYGPDGEYGVIPSFRKHQVINARERQSVIPDINMLAAQNKDLGTRGESARARTCRVTETHVGIGSDLKGREGNGSERKGREREGGEPERGSPPCPGGARLPAPEEDPDSEAWRERTDAKGNPFMPPADSFQARQAKVVAAYRGYDRKAGGA